LYVKKNKKELIKLFIPEDYMPASIPISIFTAGTPGAGKTEIAKTFMKNMNSIVHIDSDKIKEWLPGYNGSNASYYHHASALGMEKLYDYVLKKEIDVILDSTFSNYEIAHNNILRSLDKKRIVYIFYVYQNPKLALAFTRQRERVEGRHVPKKIFNKSLKDSANNVLKIKNNFGNSVQVFLIEKNYDSTIENFRINISFSELLKFCKERNLHCENFILN
jgi:predicted ABC-type ATPase